MAKRVVSLRLDEKTIQGLDELAEMMGVSRSRIAEMTLRTACGDQSVTEFTTWLFSSIEQKKGGANESKRIGAAGEICKA